MTERRFDCGDGCGECEVCRYLNHLEFAGACASPCDTVEHSEKIDKYLDDTYPHWRSR